MTALMATWPLVSACADEPPLTTLPPVDFPADSWLHAAPAEAGFGSESWEKWLAEQQPQATSKFGATSQEGWGVALVRGGRLIWTAGHPDDRRQSASVGKAFTKMALQLAIDEGLISSDRAKVQDYWTGAGEVSDERKRMDRGWHRFVNFRHLWTHKAGFPVTNGYQWRQGVGVPFWASSSGDPAADNYARIPPGFKASYASGGYWRLTQALTAIWGRSLKDVLDERICSRIGIPADRWEWLSGEEVKNDRDFYPAMPGYGEFVDPPYRINGALCVGGGGWVVMSASDLARIGLLIATRGVWKDERLIGDTQLLAGHAGGNDSNLIARSGDDMLVWAQVATKGVGFPRQVALEPLGDRNGAAP